MAFLKGFLSFFSGLIKKAGELTEKLLRGIEKRFSRLKIPLRSKLIILFITAALLALGVTVVSFGALRRTAVEQTDSYQNSAVESVSKIVEQYLLNCQRALMSLGSEQRFRAAVRNREYAYLSSESERIYRRFKIFSFVGVAFRNGDNITVPSVYPGNYRHITRTDDIHDFLRWNFSSPDTRLSRFYLHEEKKEVLVVHPVPGAVIVGGVDLDNIADLIDKITPLPGSRPFIIDHRGGLIMGHSEIADIEFNEEKGSVKIAGGKIIAYHTLNPNYNWRIGMATPEKILYRNIRDLRWLIIVFIILGIAGALLLALYFSRMITYPVARLSRGAKILGSGNLAYRITLQSGDELEALAGEFNKMAAELKKSYDSMGEKIKNATRDLEDALKEIEKKNVQIQKADKMKSEFLASMSHELRTPINAIIGFTSLMEDGTYGKLTVRQKDTLEKVQRNTEHLLNLINDILDLSKIEAGRMDLLPEEFQLKSLVHQIKEEVKPLIDKKGLEFTIDVNEDINCYNDYTRLRQILMNLISNAIKFTSEGRITVIAGKKENDMFYVEISDSGIGIKEDDLEKIFDEFVQSDSSPARRFGGTGLGLSICVKLLEMMGGEINVSSIWQRGSVFTITLPLRIKD